MTAATAPVTAGTVVSTVSTAGRVVATVVVSGGAANPKSAFEGVDPRPTAGVELIGLFATACFVDPTPRAVAAIPRRAVVPAAARTLNGWPVNAAARAGTES